MPFGGRQHKQLQKKLHQYIEIFPKIIINININHFLFQILMKKIMKTKLRIGIKISVRTRVTEGSIWRHHQTEACTMTKTMAGLQVPVFPATSKVILEAFAFRF